LGIFHIFKEAQLEKSEWKPKVLAYDNMMRTYGSLSSIMPENTLKCNSAKRPLKDNKINILCTLSVTAVVGGCILWFWPMWA